MAHTTQNATTATTVILVDDQYRAYCLLQNISDEDVFMSLGQDAVLNEGVLLEANGGAYEISKLNGNLDTSSINVIHNGTGNKQIMITRYPA